MTTLESIIRQRLDTYAAITKHIPSLKKQCAEHPDDVQARDALQHALDMQREEIEYTLSILPYIQHINDDDASIETTSAHALASQWKGTIDSIVTEKKKSNRSQLFIEYLKNIEGQCIDIPNGIRGGNVDEVYTCDTCNGQRYFDRATSSLVCKTCGKSLDHIEISSRNLSYSEEVEQHHQQFAYMRSNHLSEWLNSIQAKENTNVPDEVFEAIKTEFKKERASTRGDIKPSKVKTFLKKLGYNKYYEHTNYITYHLNGLEPPKFPRDLEQKFKNMFNMIQAPFSKHCPQERKNFLSYSYVLHKFCELLGHDEYKKYFPLLKSSSKLRCTDEIWKKICKDLGWEFIPTC